MPARLDGLARAGSLRRRRSAPQREYRSVAPLRAAWFRRKFSQRIYSTAGRMDGKALFAGLNHVTKQQQAATLTPSRALSAWPVREGAESPDVAGLTPAPGKANHASQLQPGVAAAEPAR